MRNMMSQKTAYRSLALALACGSMLALTGCGGSDPDPTNEVGVVWVHGVGRTEALGEGQTLFIDITRDNNGTTLNREHHMQLSHNTAPDHQDQVTELDTGRLNTVQHTRKRLSQSSLFRRHVVIGEDVARRDHQIVT